MENSSEQQHWTTTVDNNNGKQHSHKLTNICKENTHRQEGSKNTPGGKILT